jgi:hypothetical protein
MGRSRTADGGEGSREAVKAVAELAFELWLHEEPFPTSSFSSRRGQDGRPHGLRADPEVARDRYFLIENHTRVIREAYDRGNGRGPDMTPEETILEALARLKAIPSRHGGVPTYAAMAALDALVKERDELRELLATLADWDDPVEAERSRVVVLLQDEDPRAPTGSKTNPKDPEESTSPRRSRPASPPPP